MSTQKFEKIESTAEAWESGLLGQSEEHARLATKVNEALLNESLDLQPISLRLQKSLIEDLKLIAKTHGLGYQPLIRQLLTRFVDAEKKSILAEKVKEMELLAETMTSKKRA